MLPPHRPHAGFRHCYRNVHSSVGIRRRKDRLRILVDTSISFPQYTSWTSARVSAYVYESICCNGKVMKRPSCHILQGELEPEGRSCAAPTASSRCTTTPPTAPRKLRARSVALTAPAYVVADLVRAAVPNASDALKSFDYPPVGAVTLAYPLSAIRDDRKAADGSVPRCAGWILPLLLACSRMLLVSRKSHYQLRLDDERVLLGIRNLQVRCLLSCVQLLQCAHL